MNKLLSAVVALAAVAAAITSDAAVAAPGEIRNLGNFASTRPSRAEDINDAGEVVGYGEVFQSPSPADRAFTWSPATGTMQSLGTLSGSNSSRAHAINNAGVAVGWADYSYTPPAHGYERAFYRPAGGSMTNLGVMAGDFSRARAINTAGDVAGGIGYISDAESGMVDERGFLRRADGTVIELPRPTGALSYPAVGVNDAREVIGSFYTSPTSLGQAYLWRKSSGELIELGTFGGASSNAESINNHGDIVGFADTAAGIRRAFVRRAADGVLVPLTVVDDTLHSAAFDINEAGVIVGAVGVTPGITRAALWDSAGKLTNLDAWLNETNPTLGAFWTLGGASAINASGMVVGTGLYNDGAGGLSDGTRAYVLDASSLLVPEPASATLLAPLALLALRRRRGR